MSLLLLLLLFLAVVAMLSWRPQRRTSESSSGYSERGFVAPAEAKTRKMFYRHDFLIMLLVFVIMLLAASPA